MRGDQVQQQVDGTLEGWGGDRVGHPLTLSNLPPRPAHPGVPGRT